MTVDEARADTRSFLQAFAGNAAEGYLNLFTLPGEKSHWVNVSDLEKAADLAAIYANTLNVYIACGLHARIPHKRGLASDVSALPGLWLEIDFRDQAHAAENLPPDLGAVMALIKKFWLRPTILVHSGHGLQLWWLFPEPWTLDSPGERRRMARLVRRLQRWFQEEARTHGWGIDTTSDLARVLRLPGTWNRKPGCPVVPVTLLHLDESTRYAPDDFDLRLPEVEEERAASDRPTTGDSDFLPADLKRILSGCAWLRHCRDDAAKLPEPSWYAMLSIVGRCEGGEAAAHDLSKSHAGYTREETNRKLKQALTAAGEGYRSGPRTCANIRNALDGESYCSKCSSQGKITSPIVLGVPEIVEVTLGRRKPELQPVTRPKGISLPPIHRRPGVLLPSPLSAAIRNSPSMEPHG